MPHCERCFFCSLLTHKLGVSLYPREAGLPLSNLICRRQLEGGGRAKRSRRVRLPCPAASIWSWPSEFSHQDQRDTVEDGQTWGSLTSIPPKRTGILIIRNTGVNHREWEQMVKVVMWEAPLGALGNSPNKGSRFGRLTQRGSQQPAITGQRGL